MGGRYAYLLALSVIACGILLSGCGKEEPDERTLHEAVYNSDIEAVKSLLEAGRNINKMNKTGSTPLHVAAYRGDPEMVRFLLEKGALINIRDNDGDEPIDFARDKKTEKILKAAGARKRRRFR